MKKELVVYFLILLPVFLISAKPEKKYNNEKYRPQYHFTTEKNWLGSPAGFLYYEGEYHLFYEYNPKGLTPANFNLGHAVSADLVHWDYLPVAITPDNDSDDSLMCTAFSGSVVVDENNVLGKQKGDNKTIVIFYTSYHCGQRIAYSNDKGRTWVKYSGNPVIPYQQDDAENPRVFWYKPSGKWVMVLSRMPEGDKKNQGVSIYNSDNLVDWKFESHLPGIADNPDLIELPVDNNPNDMRWILISGDGVYVIGSFDGKTFTPQSGKLVSDFGKNYYASQTCSNIPEKDGRTIQIAWMKDGQFPDMPFKGQMTFPCELGLRTSGRNILLVRQPVKEIEALHDKSYHWQNRDIIPGINDNILKKLRGNCFDIKGTFDLKTADSFGFMLRDSKKNPGIELLYEVGRQVLSCLGNDVTVIPSAGKLSLEILVDRTSLEVFANNGQFVMSFSIAPPEGNNEMILFTHGGELMVQKLDAYKMHSIWRDK